MTRWRWMAGLMLAVATSVAHATPTAPPVDDPVAQIRAHAGDHRLVVLGELHGTRETPVLVKDLVTTYATQDIPVQLALELPTSENDALAAYVASNGDTAARKAMRSTPYWTVKDHLHDGRRSQDMLDLIEAVRVLRQQGHAVEVYGFDRLPPSEDSAPGERDAAMAAFVRERYAALAPDARLLVLTGNMHGMRSEPERLGYPPMAALLTDLSLYNVRIEARGGEFWGCRGYRRCGSLPLMNYDGASPRVHTKTGRDYDLMVFAPRFTVARLLDGSEDSR